MTTQATEILPYSSAQTKEHLNLPDSAMPSEQDLMNWPMSRVACQDLLGQYMDFSQANNKKVLETIPPAPPSSPVQTLPDKSSNESRCLQHLLNPGMKTPLFAPKSPPSASSTMTQSSDSTATENLNIMDLDIPASPAPVSPMDRIVRPPLPTLGERKNVNLKINTSRELPVRPISQAYNPQRQISALSRGPSFDSDMETQASLLTNTSPVDMGNMVPLPEQSLACQQAQCLNVPTAAGGQPPQPPNGSQGTSTGHQTETIRLPQQSEEIRRAEALWKTYCLWQQVYNLAHLIGSGVSNSTRVRLLRRNERYIEMIEEINHEFPYPATYLPHQPFQNTMPRPTLPVPNRRRAHPDPRPDRVRARAQVFRHENPS
jgi:hypothetical protein